MRKPGGVTKLLQTWTGSQYVEPGGSSHVRVVKDIAPGEIKEVHVVQMHPYAASSLVVGAGVHSV